MQDQTKAAEIRESCDGCYNDLGGLYNFCAANSEKECKEGGGFELYKQIKCTVCGEELHYPQCVVCSKCASGIQDYENAMQQLAALAEPTNVADLQQRPISEQNTEESANFNSAATTGRSAAQRSGKSQIRREVAGELEGRSMFKPILFNTEMVKAILDGRKTQTRRIIKTADGVPLSEHSDTAARRFISASNAVHKAPCETGDILWVRETWALISDEKSDFLYQYCYQTGGKKQIIERWHPSIHMPKEAARIFLRVKDVRAEQLGEIRLADCLKEGVRLTCQEEGNLVLAPLRARERFSEVWNSTIKPADLPKYGWDANPWVWVIEFERIEKPEGWPKA